MFSDEVDQVNGVDASLPLEFGAFCMLHGAHYRAYARCRLGDGQAAEHAVRCALGELLAAWPAALKLSPSAVGWHILGRRLAMALRARPRPAGDAVHRLVGGPPADAGVLHHGLGLDAKAVAGLMGCDTERATYWLMAFERHLGTEEVRAAVAALRARPRPGEGPATAAPPPRPTAGT